MEIRTEPGRLKLAAQGFIAIAFVLGLAGLGRFSFTPETRINAAFPPPPAREAQVTDALASLPLGQRKAVSDELASRMKLRALTCAKGYTPGWGTSLDEIRRTIPDTACFANADAAIDSWLGLARVARLLALPPLRRLPVKPLFAVREPIADVMVAERAGVALVSHKDGVSLVDLTTGETLRRETESGGRVGKFAPNGRVYSIADGEAMEIRRTEDGVTPLRVIRHPAFNWSLNHSSATADGRHYVNGTSALEIFSVEQMRLESVNTGEYLPQIVLGTADPDLVFIDGVLQSRKGGPHYCYLYSISRHTFAPAKYLKQSFLTFLALSH